MNNDDRDRDRVPFDFEVTSWSNASHVGESAVGLRERARQALAEVLPVPAPPPQSIADKLGLLLTLTEAAEQMHWTEAHLRTAIESHQLLAVSAREADPMIPAFQLVGRPAEIAEPISRALELLGPVCADPQTLLAWFCAPKDELGGATPVDWLAKQGDATALRLAAERDSERLR